MPQSDTHIMKWIREKHERLEAMRPLDRATVARLHDEMRILHTCNSNAIEENPPALSGTKPVPDEGITLGGKTFRGHGIT